MVENPPSKLQRVNVQSTNLVKALYLLAPHSFRGMLICIRSEFKPWEIGRIIRGRMITPAFASVEGTKNYSGSMFKVQIQ